MTDLRSDEKLVLDVDKMLRHLDSYEESILDVLGAYLRHTPFK